MHLLKWIRGLVLIILGLQSTHLPGEQWLSQSSFGLMFHYEAFKQHNSKATIRRLIPLMWMLSHQTLRVPVLAMLFS